MHVTRVDTTCDGVRATPCLLQTILNPYRALLQRRQNQALRYHSAHSHSCFHLATTDQKMHLGVFDLVKGLFRPVVGDTETLSDGKSNHYYARGRIQDRGPCPALNALANQGYL